MTDTSNQAKKQTNKNNASPRVSFTPFGFFIFTLAILLIFAYLGWKANLFPFLPAPGPFSAEISDPTSSENETQTPETSSTPTPAASQTPTSTTTPDLTSGSLQPHISKNIPGVIVLSQTEAGYFHLFAYQPEVLPVTRLTFGAWDDIHPAVSPDGSKIVFSSNRSGHYDLYLLDMTTGETQQITDDLAYEGNPDWSSDGLWIAYEKYQNNNLDIYIQSLVAETGEIRITTHEAHDFDPAWQPESRILAFTSSRNGKLDIMLGDTENTADDYDISNYTLDVTRDQHNASWSPDGSTLAWTTTQAGAKTIYHTRYPEIATTASVISTGSALRWDPTGKFMLVTQNLPDQNYLSILEAASQTYVLLPQSLAGQLNGISWGTNILSGSLPEPMQSASQQTPQAPWAKDLVASPGALYGRQNIIDIPGIEAPNPALNALAVEPFFALKDRIQAETGWDVLSDLENMFVSISQTLPPGRANDWLFTGRAFALNPALIDFDYMLVVREDYGLDTYWRVYLKPLQQDGTMGQPLRNFPWNFDARFTGSTTAYENGGQPYESIPGGYWVDFTTLSAEYGWERQQALSNWQSYYQGARFNVFAITSGLTWERAMLQVWPPEVFKQP